MHENHKATDDLAIRMGDALIRSGAEADPIVRDAADFVRLTAAA